MGHRRVGIIIAASVALLSASHAQARGGGGGAGNGGFAGRGGAISGPQARAGSAGHVVRPVASRPQPSGVRFGAGGLGHGYGTARLRGRGYGFGGFGEYGGFGRSYGPQDAASLADPTWRAPPAFGPPLAGEPGYSAHPVVIHIEPALYPRTGRSVGTWAARATPWPRVVTEHY